MRFTNILVALAATSVTATSFDTSLALESTELIPRGLDGEALILPRGLLKWDGKAAEAL